MHQLNDILLNSLLTYCRTLRHSGKLDHQPSFSFHSSFCRQLAAREETSNKYTWGWQRAEVLGALVNGVFLLALCFSIFMEAIERFFNAKEVGNPRLVVIVGSLGLLSNIVGLFLFHGETVHL